MISRMPTIRLDRPALRLLPCLETQLASTLHDMQRTITEG